jgi:hypothetical protein
MSYPCSVNCRDGRAAVKGVEKKQHLLHVKGDETPQLGHLIPTRTWSLPVVLGRQWPVTVVGGGVFCVLGGVPEILLRAEILDGAKLVVLRQTRGRL